MGAARLRITSFPQTGGTATWPATCLGAFKIINRNSPDQPLARLRARPRVLLLSSDSRSPTRMVDHWRVLGALDDPLSG
jgi:hypothetical protein